MYCENFKMYFYNFLKNLTEIVLFILTCQKFINTLCIYYRERPEAIMRTSLIRAGLGFGNLGVTVRGTTKYHLSPMEQRAFAGAISQGLPNIFWRARKSFFTVIPPFIISYLIFTETEKEHDR